MRSLFLLSLFALQSAVANPLINQGSSLETVWSYDRTGKQVRVLAERTANGMLRKLRLSQGVLTGFIDPAVEFEVYRSYLNWKNAPESVKLFVKKYSDRLIHTIGQNSAGQNYLPTPRRGRSQRNHTTGLAQNPARARVPASTSGVCRLSEVGPGLTKEALTNYLFHGFGANQNPFATGELKQLEVNYATFEPLIVKGTNEFLSISQPPRDSRTTIISKGAIRQQFDIQQLAPITDKGGVSDYKVYGAIDPVTQARIPKFIEVRVNQQFAPKLTGLRRIDIDRAAKANGTVRKHDGDQEDDTFHGSLLLKLTENGACPVMAVRRNPTETETIKLTGGREYKFGLGPNEFPPRPFTAEYEKRVQALADAQLVAAMKSPESLPCNENAEDIRNQMATLPKAVPAACLR